MMSQKEPVVFLQSYATTCGVACLMMAGDALGIDIALTEATETDLLESLQVPEYGIVPAISLAVKGREYGLKIGVVLDQGPRDFWEYWRVNGPAMYAAQKKAYDLASSVGVTIEKVSDVNADLLKHRLEGHLLLVGIDLGIEKHALLVYKWEAGFFHLVDPLYGRRIVSDQELLSQMRIDFGKWFIEFSK